jgi:hypothetical protein
VDPGERCSKSGQAGEKKIFQGKKQRSSSAEERGNRTQGEKKNFPG